MMISKVTPGVIIDKAICWWIAIHIFSFGLSAKLQAFWTTVSPTGNLYSTYPHWTHLPSALKMCTLLVQPNIVNFALSIFTKPEIFKAINYLRDWLWPLKLRWVSPAMHRAETTENFYFNEHSPHHWLFHYHVLQYYVSFACLLNPSTNAVSGTQFWGKKTVTIIIGLINQCVYGHKFPVHQAEFEPYWTDKTKGLEILTN